MLENFKLNEIRESVRPLNDAVIVAYNKMGKCFNTDKFICLVREITRKDLKEQTILNSLRVQRKNGLIGYIVLDSSRKEYRKVILK